MARCFWDLAMLFATKRCGGRRALLGRDIRLVEREKMSEQDALVLTAEERAMLDGEQGIAVQRAIEIVVALAKIYDARRLVSVSSVQVAGVSYKNLGQAGLDFLREWAEQGARVRVPTTLNPAGMDMQHWRALGFSETFARQQQAVVEAYTAMGIAPTCTCTPYLVGNRPGVGDHVAWAESSAVSFANSVLGARTNREGGPSALSAAICGRTAAYGLHLDENRLARYRVEVRCPMRTISDWSALGYVVGHQVRNGVPYFIFEDDIRNVRREASGVKREASDVNPGIRGTDELKSLGAAMAASGAVPPAARWRFIISIALRRAQEKGTCWRTTRKRSSSKIWNRDTQR
jgi:predicted aconitase